MWTEDLIYNRGLGLLALNAAPSHNELARESHWQSDITVKGNKADLN
jgi:hypothetical protein